MSRVIVVGDIVTDVLAVYSGPLAYGSDTAARIHLTAGGSAANTAAWLARTGRPVTLIGVVGDDAAGAQRRAELAQSGVDCAVRVASGAVTGSVVVLSEAAERTMLCDRGANALLSTVDIDAGMARDAVHLHLSGYVFFDGDSRSAGLHALATAARQGLTTSVDAASAGPLRRVGGATFLDWVRAADVLLANLDEARALLSLDAPAEVLAARLAEHVRHAVVKLGPDGAVWAERDASVTRVPAQPATVADPTGAGDAFAAGLLASWLTGATPEAALRSATTLGAQAVSTPGARPPARGRGVTGRGR
jgi:sugar/nucleoside kinase (ribokinase family)